MDPEQREQAQRLSKYREQLAVQNASSQDYQNRRVTNDAQNPDPMLYPGLYAPSNVNMMEVLKRVYTRPNPKINLGAIDSSCALVLCDLQQSDSPIVYASEPFLSLTQYSISEVLGRNCRFLQSPDGNVIPGSQRLDTDSKAAFQLKLAVTPRAYSPCWTVLTNGSGTQTSGTPGAAMNEFGISKKNLVVNANNSQLQEVQVTLRNYKKGGKAFDNILTIIPISWEDGGEVRYAVGFQADKATILGG